MGEYDKIIKEIVESVFIALSKKLLGFEIRNARAITEKLQTTIEREADFLKLVSIDEGRDIILHLEFQREDDKNMVYRMAEYKAILQKKYKIPVRQYVIYLGTKSPKMKTSLPKDQAITGFTLKNIHDIPVNLALESDVPEELVLAILTDYPEADAEKVITQIILKLQQVSSDEAAFSKFIKQLITIGRIRKLDEQIGKKIESMPLTYDIESDYLYKKGIEKGIEKGIKAAITEMLSDPSLTVEQIARFTKTSVEYVLKVEKELQDI